MDSEDQPSLQKRVFVGAVPVKMDESTLSSPETLRDYFASFGHIDYFKLGRNKKNQEPLGFAFVEFRDEAVTRRVLETKHHLQGREVPSFHQIDVKRFALDKDIDKQQQDVLRRKVYVKGLPPACDQTRLFEVFGAFGPVDKAFILYNHKNGSSRGFGFVEFVEEASVAKAVAQKVTICGKDIQVSLAVERHKGVTLP